MNIKKIYLLVLLLSCSFWAAARVRPGIEVLEERGFDCLQGKRVGLVTNPSGVDSRLRSTIDILYNATGFKLVALFGPEHGVRGDAWAGDNVVDAVDSRTGLPVYSLYGASREPSSRMLEGIDAMVYDIQDVGTRSYTFISTLGLVMRACASRNIEVIVLDRPNPLGGLKVEGHCPVEGFNTFVSQYRIPYIYGLTVGELANLINSEGLNRGQDGTLEPISCRLSVVPMQGWRRWMLYNDTGLPWILPSPNIPYPQTALAYPASGLCGESGYVQIGIGYTLPFGVFAAEWIDADRLAEDLAGLELPGVVFRPVHYKPIAGSKAGKLLHGVQFEFTDYHQAYVTLTQFYVMQVLHNRYPQYDVFTPGKSYAMFDKVCGNDFVRKEFSKRFMVEDIITYWKADDEAFQTLSMAYWLYD